MAGFLLSGQASGAPWGALPSPAEEAEEIRALGRLVWESGGIDAPRALLEGAHARWRREARSSRSADLARSESAAWLAWIELHREDHTEAVKILERHEAVGSAANWVLGHAKLAAVGPSAQLLAQERPWIARGGLDVLVGDAEDISDRDAALLAEAASAFEYNRVSKAPGIRAMGAEGLGWVALHRGDAAQAERLFRAAIIDWSKAIGSSARPCDASVTRRVSEGLLLSAMMRQADADPEAWREWRELAVFAADGRASPAMRKAQRLVEAGADRDGSRLYADAASIWRAQALRDQGERNAATSVLEEWLRRSPRSSLRGEGLLLSARLTLDRANTGEDLAHAAATLGELDRWLERQTGVLAGELAGPGHLAIAPAVRAVWIDTNNPLGLIVTPVVRPERIAKLKAEAKLLRGLIYLTDGKGGPAIAQFQSLLPLAERCPSLSQERIKRLIRAAQQNRLLASPAEQATMPISHRVSVRWTECLLIAGQPAIALQRLRGHERDMRRARSSPSRRYVELLSGFAQVDAGDADAAKRSFQRAMGSGGLEETRERATLALANLALADGSKDGRREAEDLWKRLAYTDSDSTYARRARILLAAETMRATGSSRMATRMLSRDRAALQLAQALGEGHN
ncbi:MAG: hypothetical protein AAF288_12755 [Planctomycetota bacterium]